MSSSSLKSGRLAATIALDKFERVVFFVEGDPDGSSTITVKSDDVGAVSSVSWVIFWSTTMSPFFKLGTHTGLYIYYNMSYLLSNSFLIFFKRIRCLSINSCACPTFSHKYLL